MTTKPTDFDKFLLHAIDETLNSLGKSVSQSIYFHIESKFRINRDEIPENLQEFQEGLEKIFGAGARFIEIRIMKNLHAKIGDSLVIEKSEQLEFVEYVGVAKQCYFGNVTKHAVESQSYTPSVFPIFTVSVSKP